MHEDIRFASDLFATLGGLIMAGSIIVLPSIGIKFTEKKETRMYRSGFLMFLWSIQMRF